jgi:ribosomal protein L7/L12
MTNPIFVNKSSNPRWKTDTTLTWKRQYHQQQQYAGPSASGTPLRRLHYNNNHSVGMSRMFHSSPLSCLSEKENSSKSNDDEAQETQEVSPQSPPPPPTEDNEEKAATESRTSNDEIGATEKEEAPEPVEAAATGEKKEGEATNDETVESLGEAEGTPPPSSEEEGIADDPNKVSYAFSPPPPLSEASQAKVQEIFDKILWLDMIELHLLTQVVNEQLGISWKDAEQGLMGGGGSMAAGGAGGAGGAAAATEEVQAKTIFDLKLVGFDAKAKIKVIKEVRAISGLGLKEAKELVESAPKVIQKEIKQEKAEELKAQLEAVGAEVELV